MRDVQELRKALAEHLKGKGLDTVTAWGGERRRMPGKALAVVSLRGLKSEGAGLQNYLGEAYNAETGQWEERYGRRLELTFGLDLYGATAEEVQAGVDALREILADGGPEGMAVTGFSAGETAYRAEDRRYQCPAQATFQVWAVATDREGETFLDFTVRGEGA